MAKSLTLDEKLAALNQIRSDPNSPQALAGLQQALNSKISLLAARAADIAGQAQIISLRPAVAAVFDRFMINPGKTDKGCYAKAAAAEALHRLEFDDEALFLRGIGYIQMEPVFGGQVDTAIPVRAACALGLVRMNYPEVMIALAALLADREPQARVAAARAIAYSNNPAGLPLLRLRVLVGDQADVLGEYFAAMLKISPATSLSFVIGFLEHEDEAVAEAAALALGESRAPSALAPLRDCWTRTLDRGRRHGLLLGIALLRSPEAWDFLLDLVRQGTAGAAGQAITALATYKHDQALRKQVEEAAQARGEGQFMAQIAEAFGP